MTETIQINKDWRIRPDEYDDKLWQLELKPNHKWMWQEFYTSELAALAGYCEKRLGGFAPTTPSDLITLLRKLTAEIEAAMKEI